MDAQAMLQRNHALSYWSLSKILIDDTVVEFNLINKSMDDFEFFDYHLPLLDDDKFDKTMYQQMSDDGWEVC